MIYELRAVKGHGEVTEMSDVGHFDVKYLTFRGLTVTFWSDLLSQYGHTCDVEITCR